MRFRSHLLLTVNFKKLYFIRKTINLIITTIKVPYYLHYNIRNFVVFGTDCCNFFRIMSIFNQSFQIVGD
ncbi:MAG: hypothetical protein D8M51_07320 [Ignavibacteriae bacterium]|nr:hypothetical protein [Ignavibacteriota bacterium]